MKKFYKIYNDIFTGGQPYLILIYTGFIFWLSGYATFLFHCTSSQCKTMVLPSQEKECLPCVANVIPVFFKQTMKYTALANAKFTNLYFFSRKSMKEKLCKHCKSYIYLSYALYFPFNTIDCWVTYSNWTYSCLLF